LPNLTSRNLTTLLRLPISAAPDLIRSLLTVQWDMAFFIYIMTNRKNGTLYVGHTDDLARRIHQHKTGATPGFTKDHSLHRLVHCETLDTREEARQRERQLNGWNRAWKIQLIEQHNPEWRDIYEDML